MANTVINVVVAKRVPINVVANNGGVIQTSEPVTIRNSQVVVGGGGGGSTTLTGLIDVTSNGTIPDGSTLVYSANSGHFIIEPIPVIEGGSF